MEREVELGIVARPRGGDRGAFDEIYAAFNDRLFTFLLRLSCRRDVAEDLFEETWLRLVTSAGRLKPDTTLGPWLCTVARNLHLSYLRSRAHRSRHALSHRSRASDQGPRSARRL